MSYARFWDATSTDIRTLSEIDPLTPFPMNWVTVWAINKDGRRTEVLRRAFSQETFNECVAYAVASRCDWKRRSTNFRQYTVELH